MNRIDLRKVRITERQRSSSPVETSDVKDLNI